MLPSILPSLLTFGILTNPREQLFARNVHLNTFVYTKDNETNDMLCINKTALEQESTDRDRIQKLKREMIARKVSESTQVQCPVFK